jgi:hypothetical protein
VQLMGILRTEKFFDAPTLERLHTMAKQAQSTPVILLSQRRLGPEGKDEATLAWERFYRELNAEAVKAGMPEPAADDDGDVINYGCDFKTGEILDWDGQP